MGYMQRFMLESPDHEGAYQGSTGKTAAGARIACEAADAPKGGHKAQGYHPTCYNPDWVREAMAQNFPTNQYFLCDMSKPEGPRLTPWGRAFNKADQSNAHQGRV